MRGVDYRAAAQSHHIRHADSPGEREREREGRRESRRRYHTPDGERHRGSEPHEDARGSWESRPSRAIPSRLGPHSPYITEDERHREREPHEAQGAPENHVPAEQSPHASAPPSVHRPMGGAPWVTLLEITFQQKGLLEITFQQSNPPRPHASVAKGCWKSRPSSLPPSSTGISGQLPPGLLEITSQQSNPQVPQLQFRHAMLRFVRCVPLSCRLPRSVPRHLSSQ